MRNAIGGLGKRVCCILNGSNSSLLKLGHEPIERPGHRVNLCGLPVQVVGDAALSREVGEGDFLSKDSAG
ncbi:hypothetical protein CFREN_03795 [Corynebacterium freneyi]|nr:hypothetical protein CFREN_03795 [Corynebacterium freneyi]